MSEAQGSPTGKSVLMVEAPHCMGCASCSAACRIEHDLPEEVHTIKVIRRGPLEKGSRLEMSFLPVTCFHCDKPACIAECPTGAMQKRADGIVFSDLAICIGCLTCAAACPYGVPVLNPATGKIAKCDGCKDRVDQGLWPSCALKCPTGALSFGETARVVQDRRQREALRIVPSFTTQGSENV